MSSAVCDMCMHGKKRPATGYYVKNSARVRGTPEVCQAIEAKCDHKHKHEMVWGKMKINTSNGTKTVPVSTWAGGYTETFCREAVEGAREFLKMLRR